MKDIPSYYVTAELIISSSELGKMKFLIKNNKNSNGIDVFIIHSISNINQFGNYSMSWSGHRYLLISTVPENLYHLGQTSNY